MRRPTRDPYARPAIQTLERLHAELGGKILENKQQHANLAEQMRHVEAVIKMLDPGYSLRAISVKRRQPNPWFKRGTVYRRAVDVLSVWASLRNHKGKGVERTNDGSPARWRPFRAD